MLHLPNEEVFTNEVQLIQLKEDCSQEEAQLGSLSFDFIQDGIVHLDQDSSGFQLDLFYLEYRHAVLSRGKLILEVTSQHVL